jgi:hypothetical protein
MSEAQCAAGAGRITAQTGIGGWIGVLPAAAQQTEERRPGPPAGLAPSKKAALKTTIQHLKAGGAIRRRIFLEVVGSSLPAPPDEAIH